MKRKSFLFAALLVLTSLSLSAANADKSIDLGPLKKELRSVAAPEMPAKAAQLVAKSDADALDATVESVVKAAIEVRPAAAVSVVSAIAKQNPAVAPQAAAKAISLRPKEAGWIARAAAGAAPEQAGKIVYAACKALPSQYAVIATAVAQAVPGSTQVVLEQVVAALPSLKSFVERARHEMKDASVGQVLAQVDSLVKVAAKSAKVSTDQVVNGSEVVPVPAGGQLPPPTLGPPFTPITTPPTETTRTNTVEIPPGGGRDYSGG